MVAKSQQLNDFTIKLKAEADLVLLFLQRPDVVLSPAVKTEGETLADNLNNTYKQFKKFMHEGALFFGGSAVTAQSDAHDKLVRFTTLCGYSVEEFTEEMATFLEGEKINITELQSTRERMNTELKDIADAAAVAWK